jgi:hypothetical protein
LSELELDFQETITEIDAMSNMAEKYIAPEAHGVLAQLKTTLESIRETRSDVVHRWGIDEAFPLITTTSEGKYQPDDKGHFHVFGEITSLWHVRRVRPSGKKSARATNFALAGNTSTRVKLFERLADGSRGQTLATWTMEVGSANGPGCHFHAQVSGNRDPVADYAFDVPRLPSFLVTPPAVLDFVLGELYQKRWTRHLASQTAHLQRWTPIQKKRISAILAWQHNVIQSAAGSPWLTLKERKPERDLWLSEARLRTSA